LFLTWTPFRRNFGSNAAGPSEPSRFLGEMPAELIQGLEESYEKDLGFGPYYVEENDEDDSEKESGEFYQRPSSRMNKQRTASPQSIAEISAYNQKTQYSGKTASDQSESKRLAKPGVRVRHPMFGDGIVLHREKVGNNIKLVVNFSRVGRKTLMEKFAKLEIL